MRDENLRIQKQEQRKYFREKRKAIPELERLSQCLTVNRALAVFLAEMIEARRANQNSTPLKVCAYMAVDPELSLEPLMEYELLRAVEENLIEFYIPKTVKTLEGSLDLIFGYYRSQAETPCSKRQTGLLGITEPSEEDLIVDLQADVVLLPCIAFDANGTRLGQGAGCYDRYLAKQAANRKEPLTVVVAYQEQKASLPLAADERDWPMDYAAFDEEVRKLKQ